MASNDTWYYLRLKRRLCAEAIKSLALALERVDNVKSGDGLAASMFAVGDGILNDVAEERAEDGAGFFIHQTGNALDTTTAGQTTNRRLRDALDVIT